MAPKITKSDRSKRETVSVKTRVNDANPAVASKWWKAPKEQKASQLLSTAMFLKEYLQYRYRQAAIYSRLYSNMPMYNMLSGGAYRMSASNQLPIDRPTMNVVQSCVDTLVSRISQARPRPVFLTDNGDYHERNVGKQLNYFMQGELYQCKAYQMGEIMLRDAAVLGSGCLKVYETADKKVGLERVLYTELYVDPNDSLYGDPRQIYQAKLVDRDVASDLFPDKKDMVALAEQAYPDNSADASKTVSDQIMVVEGWHLPSGPNSGDGRHTIACSSGALLDEEYTKPKFPFVFLHYSPRLLGFFGQSLCEQLMGTQMEINKLLITISQAINMVGVPRVFVEDGSKVVKQHLNNQIGSIVTYRGTKPEYTVAPCMPAEVYAQLQRLVDYAYQQSGVSSLAASAQKPAGLDSGTALREYDDLQSDRFAALNRRYDNMFIELAYQIIDKAKDIAERDGKYQTVYPNKNGTKEVDLPAAKLLQDPFVIQCFDSSALPRDPAGRQQKVIEMMQSGMITVAEGRRMLDYPDLEQVEKLDNAAEERILYTLDKIIEDGTYTPPDPFMDVQKAIELSNKYYNLYVPAKLSESRMEMLRTFNAQCVALLQAATPPPMPMQQPTPQAAPQPTPTNPMVPNGANQPQ